MTKEQLEKQNRKLEKDKTELIRISVSATREMGRSIADFKKSKGDNEKLLLAVRLERDDRMKLEGFKECAHYTMDKLFGCIGDRVPENLSTMTMYDKKRK